MTFDWHVSVGDIIALGSLGGSIINVYFNSNKTIQE